MPVDRLKCKTESVMPKGTPFYKFCPYCGAELLHTFQNVSQDDSNPVRLCDKCDMAWIWRIYE